MRLCYLILWISFILLLIGCTNTNNEPILSITLNPTRLEATITPTPTVPATPTETLLTLTPTMAITISSTPTPTITVTPLIETSCQEPAVVTETELASGLLLRGSWDGQLGFAMLGNKGVSEPIAYYLDEFGSSVSPDGEWVANMDFLEIIDEEKDIYTVKVTVQDWSKEHIYNYTLFNVALNSLVSWANGSKLVLSLQPEDDRFRWWIWDPVDGQEPYLLEVNLNHLGNSVQPDTQLELDPLLEYVVYECDDCSELEYWVSNLATGDVVWKITSDDAHLLDIFTYPSWSVDGQFLAFMAAELKDTIVNTVMWIFNRQGEKIYEIDMPANEQGIYGGGGMSWSPDGQYLSFFRNDPTMPSASKITLGYLSLKDGSFTNLCLDATSTLPIWSSDSTRLAFDKQIEAGLPARVIFIADILSGTIVKLFDPDGHGVVGWRNLPDAIP